MLYVYKTMPGKLLNDMLPSDNYSKGWRDHALFGLMVLMMLALFFSRALLSVSMLAFVAMSFFHKDMKGHLKHFISTPLLWGMSLLFFIPLISGIWSEDKNKWMEIVQTKLPLLGLPLAFAGPFEFSFKQWKWLAFIFIVLVAGGTGWSMYHYLSDTGAVHEGYLKAKSILTPLGNDHVRFSWLVSLAALLAVYFGFVEWRQNRTVAWLLFGIGVWLIIFLHILAARTGLFSFYIMMALTSAWLSFTKIKWGYNLLLVIGLLSLPVAAYYTLPTFQNRVKYIQYDWGYFKEANYMEGGNDAVRVISLKAGWGLIKENPAKGVGYGDILKETRNWYDSHYLLMIERDKIYPSSEWLMYGAGCGIAGLILFTLAMFIPFFVRTGNRLLWWLLNGTVLFSFLFDIGLEVQFGVFVYSFIVLWWYRWLNDKKV